MKEMPLLNPSDIEVRVQSKVFNGKRGYFARFLLYKSARTDMRILDEVFGQMNWKRSQEVINGALYCTISVWDAEKKEWVSKQDVGVPSRQDPQKGAASDAFKRAGTNWGIGRELYDAPSILISLNANEVTNGNLNPAVRFMVADCEYDKASHEFKRLILVDNQGQVRFQHGSNINSHKVTASRPMPVKNVSSNESKKLADMLRKDGIDVDDFGMVCFGIPLAQMTNEQVTKSISLYGKGVRFYKQARGIA